MGFEGQPILPTNLGKLTYCAPYRLRLMDQRTTIFGPDHLGAGLSDDEGGRLERFPSQTTDNAFQLRAKLAGIVGVAALLLQPDLEGYLTAVRIGELLAFPV